jgi:holliday junction resolvase Hjr
MVLEMFKRINTKAKGSCAERELIHLFWNNGWAAMRAAGSGSTSFPSPDIIVGNARRKIALECKITKSEGYQYLKFKEIEELKKFSVTFGAESYVAVKFSKYPWFFLMLEDLNETDSGYAISFSTAQNKGLLFEELIEK